MQLSVLGEQDRNPALPVAKHIRFSATIQSRATGSRAPATGHAVGNMRFQWVRTATTAWRTRILRRLPMPDHAAMLTELLPLVDERYQAALRAGIADIATK